MKLRLPLNIVLGIGVEVLYALFLILAAFLICALLSQRA